jgi:hypothetical protein
MVVALRKLFLFIAILTLVGFLLNIAADNPYSHRLARAVINKKLASVTNFVVRFEAIKLKVVPLGVDLYGFSISEPENQASTLIKSSHIKAEVSIWSLIIGEPKLGVLEFTDLEASWPLPPGIMKELFKDDQPSEPLSWPPKVKFIPVEKIALKNSRIYFELPEDEKKHKKPGKPFALAISGLDLTVWIKNLDNLEAELDATAVGIRSFGRSLVEEVRVGGEFNFKNGKVYDSSVSIKSALLDLKGSVDLELETKGADDLVKAVAAKIKLEGSGDLTVLGNILEIENTKGAADAKATIAVRVPIGSAAPPELLVEAHGKSKNARINDFQLYDSETDLVVNTEKVEFKNIKVMVGDKQYADGRGSIKINNAVDFDFEARPKDIPLSRILTALGVSFDTIDSEITSPDLRLRGTGDPLNLTVKATADFKRVDFKFLKLPINEAYPKAASCRLAVNLAATIKALTFDGSQGYCYDEVSDLGLGNIIPGDLKPPASAKNISTLAFSGVTNFDEKQGAKLSIRSADLNLALLSHYVRSPTMGQGSVNVLVSGPYEKIEVGLDVKSKGTMIRNIFLGDLTGNAVYKNEDQLHWSNLHAVTSATGEIVSPEGVLTLSDELNFKAVLTAKNIDTQFIKYFVAATTDDENLSFEIKNATANLSGPLLVPLAYQGSLKVELANGRYQEEPLFTSAAGEWSLTRDQIKTTKFQVALDDLFTETSFSLKRKVPFVFANAINSDDLLTRLGISDKDFLEIDSATVLKDAGTGRVRRRSAGSDGHLQKLPFLAATFKSITLDGRVSYQTKLQGPLTNLQGNFQSEVSDIVFWESKMASVRAKGIIDNSKLDLLVSHSGNALEGRINIDFNTPDLDYSWFLQANRLDLRALGSGFFASDPRNYAYLNGDWSMQGKLKDWWRSTGTVAIKDFRVKFIRDMGSEFRSMEVNSDHEIKMTLGENGWNIDSDDAFVLNGDKLRLRVLTKANRIPDNLGLAFDGIIDMGLFRDVFTQVESASGKVRFNGTIKGQIDDPEIKLDVSDIKQNAFTASTWEAVSLGFADLRPAFRNCQFKIRYDKKKLYIDSLTAEKGKGAFTANGVLNLNESSEQEDSRIDLQMNEVAVVYPVAVFKSFDSFLSGNLSITGKQRPFKLGGDIKILRARSTREFDIRDEIIGALRRRPFTSATLADQPYLNLDLNLSADKSIFITNRNVQANLSTDLHITGTELSPIVLGQFEFDRGRFVYKRDFRITQGIVTFDDPVSMDPRLDILGASDVGSYRVFVAITGRGSEPKVDLSVDPPTRENGVPLTKVDILMLLSAGSIPEASDNQLTSQNVAATEALNIVAGQFEEPVERLFEKSGQNIVRQVYIDTYADPTKNGAPTPRLNFPINVSEDWDVIYRVDGNENWRVSLGYTINDGISLSGSYEKERENATSGEQKVPAETGVDLKFQFAYP